MLCLVVRKTQEENEYIILRDSSVGVSWVRLPMGSNPLKIIKDIVYLLILRSHEINKVCIYWSGHIQLIYIYIYIYIY